MKRLLVFLFLFAAVSASAQSNDISFFLGSAKFDTTTLASFAPEDFEAELAFENGGAVTFAFNHFWRNQFSTEFSMMGIGADPTLKVSEGPVDISVDAGEIRIGVLTAAAQWHFRHGARVSPYVGGGIALIGGEIEAEGEDEEGVETEETVDLEGAGTLLINAGLNIRINDRWIFAIDAKAIPYTAEIDEEEEFEEDAPEELDLNPFILSVGIRYRF